MIGRLSTYRWVSALLALLLLVFAVAVPLAAASCTRVPQGTSCPCGPSCCGPLHVPASGSQTLSNAGCCSLTVPEPASRPEVIPSTALSQSLAHEAGMILALCSPVSVPPETGMPHVSSDSRHLTPEDIPVFHLSLLI